MTLGKMLELILRPTANITLCHLNGMIFYEGAAKEIPKSWKHYEVIGVDGLGCENDLFITVNEK